MSDIWQTRKNLTKDEKRFHVFQSPDCPWLMVLFLIRSAAKRSASVNFGSVWFRVHIHIENLKFVKFLLLPPLRFLQSNQWCYWSMT